MTVCFLSRATELFGLHYESLTSTQKFRISPRVSYTDTEISDISTGLLHLHRNSGYLQGLLHPHRNFGYLHGSLTITQKFGISPWVSYTHTKIRDISPGLLHPHRNSGYLPGSLGLLHPHRNSGYLPGSLTPTQDLSDIIAGLLHPNSRLFHMRGLTSPFLLCPTHINYYSFLDLNYESSLDIVPKTNSTHTHQEW